jgi:hypothetical protein
VRELSKSIMNGKAREVQLEAVTQGTVSIIVDRERCPKHFDYQGIHSTA